MHLGRLKHIQGWHHNSSLPDNIVSQCFEGKCGKHGKLKKKKECFKMSAFWWETQQNTTHQLT